MEEIDQMIQVSGWLSHFEGKSIFITGSMGLICSEIVDLLLRYSELHNNSIIIYSAARNKNEWEQRFSKYAHTEMLKYVPYDATKKNQLIFEADYVIHGAGIAFPHLILQHPIDTMTISFCGMLELLEYACKHQVINTVFISSSQVYGEKSSLEPFDEDEHGYIDILNPRSSYAVGKMAAETLCKSYVHERKTPVSIVRPGHVYGPTTRRDDNRISSVCAFNVLDREDIILKSDGSQIRSYCYVLDCATAILKVLLEGKSGEAYNISNPQSVLSIRELAELFAIHGQSQVRFEEAERIEKAAFNPMKNSSLNSSRLQRLGWQGMYDAQRGTAITLRILREASENIEMK